ncbi:hypothetical protein [Tateyamaria sp. Alg231-49]|uniref:hypothetical protein n=1 Tax=Tateyamaria sp. Alg231-49 TaxID=1922219 RepID=UPI000D561047|nr:hypothetical protein [Tateyamaria sp. Alg231-49]
MPSRTPKPWSHYQKMRKENPRQYRTGAVQNQMLQDREYLGQSFYKVQNEDDKLQKAVKLLEEIVGEPNDTDNDEPKVVRSSLMFRGEDRVERTEEDYSKW